MKNNEKDIKPKPPTVYCPSRCGLLRLRAANPRTCAGCRCLDYTPYFEEVEFQSSHNRWEDAYIVARYIDHRGDIRYLCVMPEDESEFDVQKGPVLRKRGH